jgi:hypothetical protein
MEEKLKGTIKRIVQLTQQNPEFGEELRKALKIESSAISVYDSSLPTNVKAIREALEIRAYPSVNYEFIKEEERLYSQLYIDNLRMENAALNLKDNEFERFYTFCINAFYQIENIINYYYFKTYPDITELKKVIIEATKNDGNNGEYAYKPKDKDKVENVGDIHISYKINAFCNTFFPNDNIKFAYINLRKVRNEGEHRCMIIIKNKEEENSIYKFFNSNSFNSVRILLKKLVNEIHKQIDFQRNTSPKVEGEIITMLPSGCFIKYNGHSCALPLKLFKKVQGLSAGAKVLITLNNENITDIERL